MLGDTARSQLVARELGCVRDVGVRGVGSSRLGAVMRAKSIVRGKRREGPGDAWPLLGDVGDSPRGLSSRVSIHPTARCGGGSSSACPAWPRSVGRDRDQTARRRRAAASPCARDRRERELPRRVVPLAGVVALKPARPAQPAPRPAPGRPTSPSEHPAGCGHDPRRGDLRTMLIEAHHNRHTPSLPRRNLTRAASSQDPIAYGWSRSALSIRTTGRAGAIRACLQRMSFDAEGRPPAHSGPSHRYCSCRLWLEERKRPSRQYRHVVDSGCKAVHEGHTDIADAAENDRPSVLRGM